MDNTNTDLDLKPRDFAGTAWINLKNASLTTDPYVRNERLLVARQDLESAGETMAADFVGELLGGHAYFSHVVPVILARLEKTYGFSQ